MKSYATLINLATTMSQNASSANQQYLAQRISDEYRYLLQDYFDNERSFTTTSVGPMTLAVTASLAGGATAATLTGAWNYPEGEQVVTFTNAGGSTYTTSGLLANAATSGTLSTNWTGPTGLQSITFTNSTGDTRDVMFTNGAATMTWTIPLTSATTSTSITTAATSETHNVRFLNGSTSISWTGGLYYSITSTSISTQGYQKYRIPAGISKTTNANIYVGQLRFIPAPIMTRTEWDNINFLPYNSNIPNYFFIYGNNIEFWPIPSSTGEPITFNYKSRVADLSLAWQSGNTAWVPGNTATDYTAGTISSISGSTVTGSGTGWNSTYVFPQNVDISAYNLYLRITPPNGDGIWYPIYQFTGDTSLILATPYNGSYTVPSGSSYAIGQMPVLSEDFHDMPVLSSLKDYFSTIAPDMNKFKAIDEQFNRKLAMLAEYAGVKQINYNLGERPQQLNPNIYYYAQDANG